MPPIHPTQVGADDSPTAPADPTRVTVVVPCFNEEAVVARFHRELAAVADDLPGYRFTFLFVDDGSDDGTLAALDALTAADPRVEVVSLSRNYGHQVALSAGLDHARGDAVVMMDGDLQHPPALLPTLLARWREGYDVVSAVRAGHAGEPALKRFTSRLFYRVFNALSSTRLVPGAADFCLLSARAHRALLRMPERHRFLRGMISWIGFPRALVPFDAPARAAGRSKYGPLRMLALAGNALFSFSAFPLQLATRIGGLIVLAGGAYLAVILWKYFAGEPLVLGWTSLLSVVLILGGTQLVFIGLIGNYLARIFDETKRRPLYFAKRVPRGNGGPASPDDGP